MPSSPSISCPLRTWPVLFVLFLCGCGNQSADVDTNGEAPEDSLAAITVDQTTPSSVRDTAELVAMLDSTQLAQFTPFFSTEQVAELMRFKLSFEDIATIEDLERVFDSATTLGSRVLVPPDTMDMYESMEYYEVFQNADLGIPGVYASCVAECTEPTFNLHVEDFLEKASQTESEIDNQFFELIGSFYDYVALFGGNLEGYPMFFTRTWDYGGHSRLGEGYHESLLPKIDEFISIDHGLSAYVWQMRATLIYDAVGMQACYGNDTQTVLSELRRLKTAKSIDEDELSEFNDRIAALEIGSEAVETGCATGGCSCDSG